MGIFDGLNTAKLYENGTYLSDDFNGKLRVEKILVKDTRAGFKGFIVECTVTETNNEKDSIGSKRSWFQKMNPAETAWPAIKGFMYAMLGYDYSKDKEFITSTIEPQLDKLTDGAISDKQPFTGRIVAVQTQGITTKTNQKHFTRHNFYPADKKVFDKAA